MLEGDAQSIIIVIAIIITVIIHTIQLFGKGNTFFETWGALLTSSTIIPGIIGVVIDLISEGMEGVTLGVFFGTFLLALVPSLIGAVVIIIKER